MTEPHVVAVVLNWNNYHDTQRCLDSLRTVAYENLEVLVVDNGSDDESGARIDATFDDVTVHFTDENFGFAGGMNAGIRAALDTGADYVWLLNNDSLYEEPAVLQQLVNRMEGDDDIGMATPTIYRYPDTDDLWFVRGTVDDRSCNANHHASPSLIDLRLNRPPVDSYRAGSLVENDYIPLCSALISREALTTVGLLPEDYFLYYEDVAFCHDLRAAGYRLVTLTDATSYHKVSASSEGGATSAYYSERNRILFARETGRLTPTFVFMTLWRLFLLGGHNFLRRNYELTRAILTGALAGVRGEYGRGPYP